MKKIIYLLVWIGMTLASCSDESSLPIQPEIPAEPETPKDEPAPEKDYHQLPVLHVEGRYLKNEKGETVNLHGFTQTYSPFFNDNAWTNYDVQSCLSYNKRMVDGIDGSSTSCGCISTLIGAMILQSRLYDTKGTNAFPRPVSASISTNCLCRWRSILYLRECMW